MQRRHWLRPSWMAAISGTIYSWVGNWISLGTSSTEQERCWHSATRRRSAATVPGTWGLSCIGEFSRYGRLSDSVFGCLAASTATFIVATPDLKGRTPTLRLLGLATKMNSPTYNAYRLSVLLVPLLGVETSFIALSSSCARSSVMERIHSADCTCRIDPSWVP